MHGVDIRAIMGQPVRVGRCYDGVISNDSVGRWRGGGRRFGRLETRGIRSQLSQLDHNECTRQVDKAVF